MRLFLALCAIIIAATIGANAQTIDLGPGQTGTLGCSPTSFGTVTSSAHSVSSLCLGTPSAGAITPFTGRLQILGNPFVDKGLYPSRYYPRNIWDMQLYGGKIYIGNGNASNLAPSSNAGPAYMMTLDPTTNTYASELTTSDEQIDSFSIIGGQIVAPGIDALGSPSNGNFYRSGGTWSTISNVPNAVHVFDIYGFGGKLFAALDTSPPHQAIVESIDNGASWHEGSSSSDDTSASRVRSFFELSGNLYASAYSSSSEIYSYSEGLDEWTILPDARVLFPGLSTASFVKHPTQFGSHLVYLGVTNTNDSQWTAGGLFVASTTANASRVTMPGGARPWDIIVAETVSGNRVYALGSIGTSAPYIITVSSSSDLFTWTEDFRFTYGTFARSFEYDGGFFYFGMGSETSPLSSASGDIVRYGTARAEPTSTVTITLTPSVTSTTAPTSTPTASNTPAQSPTPSNTPLLSSTPTATGTITVTPTRTQIPAPATGTAKPVATFPPGVTPVTGQNCSAANAGYEPIPDMVGTYQGYGGGLYGGGSNSPSAGLLANALAHTTNIVPRSTTGSTAPAQANKIVFLSIGLSNTLQESAGFQYLLTRDTAVNNSRLIFVTGATNGATADQWADYNYVGGPFQAVNIWDQMEVNLGAYGVTDQQVQAVWLKTTYALEQRSEADFIVALEADLQRTVANLNTRFPNLQVIYVTSRMYGGFATGNLSPEPYAYASGFAFQQLVVHQATGYVPILWAPYIWNDGTVANSDGWRMDCPDDFAGDGTHPYHASPPITGRGVMQIGQRMLDFFKYNETSRSWFCKGGVCP